MSESSTSSSAPLHTITLASGTFPTDGAVSILDAALAAGVPVPFSCQRGECGSCRAQVVSGRHALMAPPTERSYVPAHDELLMCQCRAVSDLTLHFRHWQAPEQAPQRREATVVSRRWLTPDVTELIVDIQGDDAFDYQAGQHVSWLLPDGGRRSFSIANPPRPAGPHADGGLPTRLEFHIRRQPGGVFTDGMLPALRPGDVLSLEGPQGACVWPPAGSAWWCSSLPSSLPASGSCLGSSSFASASPAAALEDVQHVVLLATGTGFAGVFPILMAALESRALQSITLYWGARQADDCYAAGLLNALQGKDTVFRWHSVISGESGSAKNAASPAPTPASPARHVQDRAAAANHDWAHTLVYACGNPAMVRAARQQLMDAGLPGARFHAEAFVRSGAVATGAAIDATTDAAPPAHPWERVSARFTLDGILQARQRSIAAVKEIAALLRPGMTTASAIALADAHLRQLGASHNWHPTYIRFGPDTQSPAVQPTDRQRVLGADDIFVVDIGPVWDGYEGDYGDTYSTGANVDQLRCAQAARQVFERTRLAWLGGLTGAALYDIADVYAREYGCTVVREIAGHRVADFPHALYGKHQLANADFIPADGIWVLEIQVRDLTLPIGAFYEDVLLKPSA